MVSVFAMDVRDLDIDLIDRINPFGEVYAILAKTTSEASRALSLRLSRQNASTDDRRSTGACETSPQVQAGTRSLPDILSAMPGNAWLRVLSFKKKLSRGSECLNSLTRNYWCFGCRGRTRKAGCEIPREERIIAGFEEIQRFVEENGRANPRR